VKQYKYDRLYYCIQNHIGVESPSFGVGSPPFGGGSRNSGGGSQIIWGIGSEIWEDLTEFNYCLFSFWSQLQQIFMDHWWWLKCCPDSQSWARVPFDFANHIATVVLWKFTEQLK